MKKPKVSVLMPAYNSEKYISEAIESILNQTYKDFEFIIINDGSTDKTANIIKEYAGKDKRIKFINHKKNTGISKTRNDLLKMAKGEYLAYLDSDDIAINTRLKKQVKFLEKHTDIGVVGGSFQCFGEVNVIVKHPEKITFFSLLQQCCIANPTVLIRKSVLTKNNITYNQDYKTSEDYELWSRLVLVTKIQNIPDVLTKYRVLQKSLSHNNPDTITNDNKIKQNMLNVLTKDKQLQSNLINIINGNKEGVLPKWIGKIICLFIPIKKYRRYFRQKFVKGF